VAGGIATHPPATPPPMGNGKRGKGPELATNAGARAVSLAMVALLLVGGGLTLLGGGARAYTPQDNLEPNPALAGNVTFSTHPGGAAALQYTDSFGHWQNLSANLDPTVRDPITLNPSDALASGVLQANKLGGTGGLAWNATGSWSSSVQGGAVQTIAQTTVNGAVGISDTVNTSLHGADTPLAYITIPKADYPSTTLSFDWLTITGFVTFPATSYTGTARVQFNDGSSCYVNPGWYGTNGSLEAATSALQTISGTASAVVPFFFSVPESLLMSTGGAGCAFGSSETFLQIAYVLPTAASVNYVTTVTGVGLTTGALTFGPTIWNAKNGTTGILREADIGNLNLTTLSPSFAYTSIAGGGYTAAIAQAASLATGVTISEVPLGNGSEQVSYGMNYGLPTAPSLTYGSFKLTDTPRLAAWQYVSINYAAVSYISVYQASAHVNNYTTIVSSVSATTAETWTGTVVYTEAQWVSISGPPAFFSTNGIAYWFWVAVGALGGLFALGGTVAFAGNKEASYRVR
jgi:hypothetical protein